MSIWYFFLMNIFSQLYEQILAENEKLKAQLHDTNMELTDLKLQLEKTTQVCMKQKSMYLTDKSDSKLEATQAMGCFVLGISFVSYPKMGVKKSTSLFLKRNMCRILVFSYEQNV